MHEPRIANTALTVFRVDLRAELAPEGLLDSPITVEEDEGGAMLVSTADPDAKAKLSTQSSSAQAEPAENAGRIIH